MQLKQSLNTKCIDSSEFIQRRKPFDIKIRQTGKLNAVDSVIWPWAFPSPLKEHLTTKGKIVQLNAGACLNLAQSSKQIIVIIQGSMKACSQSLKHKKCILAFYFSGDAFEYSHETILGAELKYKAIQNSFIYIGPLDFTSCTNKEQLEFTRFLMAKRKQITLNSFTHLTVMATFNAQEKIAFFLINLHQRLAIKNQIHLPMSRLDISYYLSLTPETISRELNSLQHLGLLKINRGDIELYNLAALAELYA